MHYNFPEIKKKPASLIQQLNKIVEEASEAIKARDDIERDYEIMDLLHACETYLRIRESQGVDLERIKSFVISKNKQRGYYKEE
ncbi:hypothetical protein Calow_0820 [Caldicellulosiruptor owensensis OL]|uniref:NTP pyrophosphohydrolase MazG putative catalytic core domain-containing protein n=1 Tax=Caldicellulosiruptor owensensis (strain ATCC 700167 / DSM 13100 / OL) TaxID=632518 RepID=E4Q614_CALOW|nr:hypothetical protein [Caldicellulosiruptor owensensis]ADQ04388.1 hypothetical protein Calow_0820 [Caldicellulosiruptor owensensis OL]